MTSCDFISRKNSADAEFPYFESLFYTAKTKSLLLWTRTSNTYM